MIAFLTGRLAAKDERTVTLDVHGVGFRLFVLPRTVVELAIGAETELLTYLHVREDILELYGFATLAERRLFEKLLTVSGVGPKMALGVMSAASAPDLEAAIERGDAGILTKVSGVGTKTAERIIVDLRGQFVHPEQPGDDSLSAVIDALVGLGYTSREAREAAAATPADEPVEKRIGAALKRMGK